MPRKNEGVETATEVAEEATAKATAKELKNSKVLELEAKKERLNTEIDREIENAKHTVRVFRNGVVVREYSLGDHGEDYKELAQGLAAKENAEAEEAVSSGRIKIAPKYTVA